MNRFWLSLLLAWMGWVIWVVYPMLLEPDVIYYTDENDADESAYQRIKKSGVLRVATRLNGVGCFYKRGKLRGLECEILKNYAEEMGWHLQLVYESDLNGLFRALINRNVDLVAADLTPTPERAQFVEFSAPIMQTREVLIQRQDYRVSNLSGLKHKTVSVRKGSVYEDELNALSETTQIFTQFLSTRLSTLEIIKGVADGEWSYTIADEHIARSPNAQYSSLAAPIVFGEPRNIAFAFNLRSEALVASINQWLKSSRAQAIITAYQSQQNELRSADYLTISPWDHYFQKYSEAPFSWLWLAAQAYTESAFKADARSAAGAKGIMQLMRETATDMQVLNVFDPAENIEGGAKYNLWLYQNYWKQLPLNEALAFTFASYNAGIGHVLDAQRVARHDGGDPYKWFGSVEHYIVRLEQQQVYTKPYVKHGYCRGSETRDYVQRIFNRYTHYRKAIESPPKAP